jgi:hypothetical protein
MGYKIVEITIEYRERVGKSKIKDKVRILRALFSVAYTETFLHSKMILFAIFIFDGMQLISLVLIVDSLTKKLDRIEESLIK